MKRYIDLRDAAWADKTASRIRETKRARCLAAFGAEPPCAGVIDTLPMETLEPLIAAGWTVTPCAPGDLLRRRAARRAVSETLADDADCLSPDEHTLVERMLIGDGFACPETAQEMEAALTLRLRLWCDVGMQDGKPCVRLDAALLDALPPRDARLLTLRYLENRSQRDTARALDMTQMQVHRAEKRLLALLRERLESK